jgi:transposase
LRSGQGAPGKNNLLFFGHHEAGEGSVVIYTLPGNFRRHGINPFDYLKDLFTRLLAAKITEIKQFTPRAWPASNSQLKATPPAA